MKEIWKDITDYENLYQVSNLGRVKSLRSDKILKQYVNHQGYAQVTLSLNNIRCLKRVSRLVGYAFLSKNDVHTQINHIDENKLNNIVNNLEWVTSKDNINHGTRTARMQRTQGTKITCSNGKTYMSMSQASRELNISISSISHHLSGKITHVGGYTFKKVEETK